MKAVLAVVLVSLAVASAKPPKMDKECFENRPKVRPSECCTGSTLIDAAALQSCHARFPVPTPSMNPPEKATGKRGGRHHHRGSSCVFDCYFNQTSVSKNGVLDKATALTVLGQNMDDALKATLATSLDTCLAMHEQFKSKFNKDKKPKKNEKEDDKKFGPRCDRTAAFLVHCVEAEIFKSCPASNKVSSDDCNALNTFLDKCMPKKQ